MAFTLIWWGFFSLLYFAIWDPILQLIAISIYPIVIIIIILWFDALSRESLDPVKSGILISFVTAAVTTLLLGYSVIDTALFYACAIWGVILLTFFALKIYHYAPRRIQRKSVMFVAGSIISWSCYGYFGDH